MQNLHKMYAWVVRNKNFATSKRGNHFRSKEMHQEQTPYCPPVRTPLSLDAPLSPCPHTTVPGGPCWCTTVPLSTHHCPWRPMLVPLSTHHCPWGPMLVHHCPPVHTPLSLGAHAGAPLSPCPHTTVPGGPCWCTTVPLSTHHCPWRPMLVHHCPPVRTPLSLGAHAGAPLSHCPPVHTLLPPQCSRSYLDQANDTDVDKECLVFWNNAA